MWSTADRGLLPSSPSKNVAARVAKDTDSQADKNEVEPFVPRVAELAKPGQKKDCIDYACVGRPWRATQLKDAIPDVNLNRQPFSPQKRTKKRPEGKAIEMRLEMRRIRLTPVAPPTHWHSRENTLAAFPRDKVNKEMPPHELRQNLCECIQIAVSKLLLSLDNPDSEEVPSVVERSLVGCHVLSTQEVVRSAFALQTSEVVIKQSMTLVVKLYVDYDEDPEKVVDQLDDYEEDLKELIEQELDARTLLVEPTEDDESEEEEDDSEDEEERKHGLAVKDIEVKMVRLRPGERLLKHQKDHTGRTPDRDLADQAAAKEELNRATESLVGLAVKSNADPEALRLNQERLRIALTQASKIGLEGRDIQAAREVLSLADDGDWQQIGEIDETWFRRCHDLHERGVEKLRKAKEREERLKEGPKKEDSPSSPRWEIQHLKSEGTFHPHEPSIRHPKEEEDRSKSSTKFDQERFDKWSALMMKKWIKKKQEQDNREKAKKRAEKKAAAGRFPRPHSSPPTEPAIGVRLQALPPVQEDENSESAESADEGSSSPGASRNARTWAPPGKFCRVQDVFTDQEDGEEWMIVSWERSGEVSKHLLKAWKKRFEVAASQGKPLEHCLDHVDQMQRAAANQWKDRKKMLKEYLAKKEVEECSFKPAISKVSSEIALGSKFREKAWCQSPPRSPAQAEDDVIGLLAMEHSCPRRNAFRDEASPTLLSSRSLVSVKSGEASSRLSKQSPRSPQAARAMGTPASPTSGMVSIPRSALASPSSPTSKSTRKTKKVFRLRLDDFEDVVSLTSTQSPATAAARLQGGVGSSSASLYSCRSPY